MSLPANVIRQRLEALYGDLGQLNAEVQCSWPTARVFNALLAETREYLADDPVVGSMGSLKPADKSTTLSAMPNGTVRTLAGQLIVALPAV